MNHRLILTTLFHTIFGAFGTIEANSLNYLGVPLKQFFNESLSFHYGVDTTEKEFNLIFSIIASMALFGGIIGGLLIGYLMDFYGRKATAVYIRGILGMISAISMIGAKYFLSVELFTIGHFLSGVVTSLKIVLLIFVAECAPNDRRGITGMVVGTGGSLVMLAIQPLCLPAVFGNESKWIGLPGICLVMAIIHVFGGLFIPESPKHLYIAENKKSEAAAAIQYYHGDSVDIGLNLKPQLFRQLPCFRIG